MATKDLTVVYYTDNSLKETIFSLCIKEFKKSVGDLPVISVSQKPIDLGKNICIGEVGRSYTNYYKQIITGAMEAKTKYVATVEHDVLYAPDHFNFTPPDDNTFYYDTNIWYVNYETGEYSYRKRRVQSMMICDRELLIRAIKEKLQMTLTDYPSEGKAKFQCEPGVCDYRPEYIQAKTDWCNRLGLNYEYFKNETYHSDTPCIDIRHKGNFSNPASYKVAKEFTNKLPYWGTFKELCLTLQ